MARDKAYQTGIKYPKVAPPPYQVPTCSLCIDKEKVGSR
mgnify:CR=1 FL=1